MSQHKTGVKCKHNITTNNANTNTPKRKKIYLSDPSIVAHKGTPQLQGLSHIGAGSHFFSENKEIPPIGFGVQQKRPSLLIKGLQTE